MSPASSGGEGEGDDRQVWPAYTSREGRIARSWRLTGDAWRLLWRDRTSLVLALWGAVSVAAAVVLIMYLGGYFDDPGHSGGHLALVFILGAYPTTFLGVFFNVALVSAARAAMDGEHLTLGQALGEAGSRIGRIALWSLLAAGVGVILEQIASRLPWGGSIVSWLVGAAWSLATIFVIPVLVLEDHGALGSVKRSASLMKERWGESIAGSLTITAWTVVAVIPICIVVGAGVGAAQSDPVAGSVLLVAGMTMLMLVAGIAGAVREIFALALYRFATGEEAKVFRADDLQRPFTPRRGD